MTCANLTAETQTHLDFKVYYCPLHDCLSAQHIVIFYLSVENTAAVSINTMEHT